MKDIFKNKKILITGNTGFKGAWLTLYLDRISNCKLIGYSDRFHWNNGIFNKKNIDSHIKQYWGNIKNYKFLNKIIQENQPDIIFHFAAQPLVSEGYINPKNTYDVNINGTINVLESLRNLSKPSHLVLITSDKVYKNKSRKLLSEENELGGLCPYSSSKACTEIIAENYSHIVKNKYINTVRAGNVLGGGDWSKDRIIPDIFRAYVSNKSITIRYPNATRPWSYVLDIIRGYLYTAEHMIRNNNDFESFNFSANASSKSVGEMTNDICNMIGYKNKVIYDPNFPGKEAESIKLSNKKSKQILKWNPIYDFDKILKSTTDWYMSFYNNKDMLEVSKDLLEKYISDIKINAKKNSSHNNISYRGYAYA